MLFRWFLIAAVALAAKAQAPIYTYRVTHTYPHDAAAFTEGLEYRGGYLYESTGIERRSSVRKIELETGKILQRIDVAPELFGEGITVINQMIVALTYRTHLGFVYDQANFHIRRTFSYPGEGWGLTNDGDRIYMSDGTSQIRVWDGVSLGEIRRINVHDGTKPVEELNELEWVRGEIYANVWKAERIARIAPKDGRVTGWIDLAGILSKAGLSPDAVLNGIAYDSLGGRLFVTGKYWPKLFEIQVVRRVSGGPGK
jgi:glutaminyl-peptide cyclotransferase